MYITVRTTIHNRKEDKIVTDVKYYPTYELARTNLIMQKDILILELLIKYASNSTNLDDFIEDLNEYGTLTFEGDVLEFRDFKGEYLTRYEIKKPLNEPRKELITDNINIDLDLL